MNIREAILKAGKSTGMIYRKSDQTDLHFYPTDEPDCIKMILENGKLLSVRWNPKRADLIADDWEVYDQK